MINNNRQQNGRRRGRGGQRQGGGNQGNGSRIDNRARGNAVQLLEKYKNLASEAQRQGDRVNTEYYLQFADHYFRVVSEQRGRFEEQDRQRRENQGGFDQGFDGDDDFDGDEQDARDTQPQQRERGDRDGNREPRRGDQGRDQGQREQARGDQTRDDDRGNRGPRRERFQRTRDENGETADVGPVEGVPAVEGEPIAAAEQPRTRRPRTPRAPLAAADAPRDTFDADRLPPSFAPANDGGAPDEQAEAEAKPRRRRLRPAGDATQAG